MKNSKKIIISSMVISIFIFISCGYLYKFIYVQAKCESDFKTNGYNCGLDNDVQENAANMEDGEYLAAGNQDGDNTKIGAKFQWYIDYTESYKAWSMVKQTKTVKVAVVDTGVDYNHPDLKNRVMKEWGYDFVSNTRDAMDDDGHGTQVAGIIAAEGKNVYGVIGVTGTLDVKIIPVKVLNKEGEGKAETIAKGIKYAADCGADIINLSFGAKGSNKELDNAVEYAASKGVFVVVSAGNDNTDCDQYSPASNSNVYVVSAIDKEYKKTKFSNFGNTVRVAAPGVEILSTSLNDKYEVWSGTSMAAPVVSGIAAIIKANNPNITPKDVGKVLDNTAVDIMDKGKDKYTGAGIVNAYRAISMLKGLKY